METNVCKTVDNKDGTYTITFIVDQTGSFNLGSCWMARR